MPGTLKLETGKAYRAVVRVDVPKMLVSRSAVQSRFAELGFSDVVAWLDAGDLPSDWPANQRPAELPHGWPAFVQAKWGNPPTTLEKPEAIVASWEYVLAAGATPATPMPPKAEPVGEADPLAEGLKLAGRLFLLSLVGKLFREILDEAFLCSARHG